MPGADRSTHTIDPENRSGILQVCRRFGLGSDRDAAGGPHSSALRSHRPSPPACRWPLREWGLSREGDLCLEHGH